jgi:hypothetical protein
MRILSACALAVMLASDICAQEKPSEAFELVAKYDQAVRSIRGVREITVGPVEDRQGVVIRVADEESGAAVRLLLGDKLGGRLGLFVIVSKAEAPAVAPGRCPGTCGCGPACGRPLGMTQVAPVSSSPLRDSKVDVTRLNDPTYAYERCDVMRRWLGLPALKGEGAQCQEMISTSNDPDKIRWVVANGFPHQRSEEVGFLRGSDLKGLSCPQHGTHAAGEIICYTWIKHRQFCPMGIKQVLNDILRLTPISGR